MRSYLYLFLSIVFEVIGTTFLKLSAGFTQVIPSILLLFFYGLSFLVFVFALKNIPLSIGYSIWSGLGTAGAVLIGVFMFNEIISGINIVGLIMIIGGVVLMNMKRTSEDTEKAYSS